MSDLSKRILNALSDRLNEVLKSKKNMQSMVYKDEPIIRPASDVRPPAKPKPVPSPVPKAQDPVWRRVPSFSLPSSSMPEPYLKMRKIASDTSSYYVTRDEIFYRQALLMQDMTDDYAFHGASTHYMPVYQSLSSPQLRGYFTWRTHRRQGIREDGCSDYIKIYICELIHQIGVPDPLTGLKMLEEACRELVLKDPLFVSDTPRWIRDYILYYQLDVPLPGGEESEQYDQALSVFFDREHCSDQAFLDAVCQLSSYRFENSRFYKENPAFCARIARSFFRELSAYYDKHRKTGLDDSLFGRRSSVHYFLFQNAVFYDYMPGRDLLIKAGAFTEYKCRGRWWSLKAYQGSLRKNKNLGQLMRAFDRVLREDASYPYPLRDNGTTPKYIEAMLLKVLKEDKKQQEQAVKAEKKPAPRLEFDLSGLDAIRRASDRTRDSLIVEEEYPEEEPAIITSMSETPVETVEAAAEEAPSLLSEEEKQFLSLLIRGEPWDGFLRSKGLLLSVLVDSINDKLYDEFSDTVLLLDGHTPEIIEDYLDDLKGYL